MGKITETLKKVLLYNGLSKESYKNVEHLVMEENCKNLFVFSIFAVVGFTSGMLMRLAGDYGMKKVSLVIIDILFVGMMILAKTVARKSKPLCDFLVYTFTIVLLGSGVYAAISQPTERTTLLLPFFVFSAVLFCERLVAFLAISLGTEAIYLVLIRLTQESSLVYINTINTLIFCGMGVFVAIYIMRMKYKKNETDYFNKFLIERDALTGVYNRHSCGVEMGRIVAEKQPVTVCVFDVNGLKQVNDNMGHMAGDELLIASATCIKKVFGPYGKVFRTGGDEFLALLSLTEDKEEQLQQEFAKEMAAWKGEYVESMHISCGMVHLKAVASEEQLAEALKSADELMYEEKRKYYEANGLRKR